MYLCQEFYDKYYKNFSMQTKKVIKPLLKQKRRNEKRKGVVFLFPKNHARLISLS